MYTRRESGALAMAGLVRVKPALAFFGGGAASAVVNGVRLGVQTYSFRDLPRSGPDAIDDVIRAMHECELVECELFAPQVEPQFNAGARGRRGDPASPEAVKAREDLRKWRLETPLDHFKEIGEKF